MDIIKIGIFTKDQTYGIALGKKLVQYQTSLLISIFDSDQVDVITSTDDFDLFLIDGPSEFIKGKYIGLVENLSDSFENDEAATYKLYKYGNVKLLAAKIQYIYSRITGRRQVSFNSKSVKMIVFCSPYGGSGVSSVAKGVAEEFIRYMDRKVLYLSMEEIQKKEENQATRSLEEYLYHISKNDAISSCIEPFLVYEKGGFQRFKNAGGLNPLNELENDTFLAFLNAISETGIYDYIFIDSGQKYNATVVGLMRYCYKVCMVENETRNSLKSEAVEDFLKVKIGADMSKKLYKVLNQYKYGEVEQLQENSKVSSDKTVVIDFDPLSFHHHEETDSASIDLDFGNGIKRLSAILA